MKRPGLQPCTDSSWSIIPSTRLFYSINMGASQGKLDLAACTALAPELNYTVLRHPDGRLLQLYTLSPPDPG